MKHLKSIKKVQNLHPAEAAKTVKKVKRLGRIVPNVISKNVGRQILQSRKHSPTILFGVGVVGVIATTVTACRATLKLEEVLEETKENFVTARTLRDNKNVTYTERDYQKDVGYLYVRSAVAFTKLYGPTFVLGVTSIGALTGAHNILSKRNFALTAAYAAVEKGFNEYRQRVVEELGEDKERELRYSSETRTIVEETKQGPKKVEVKRASPWAGSVYARFFDEYSTSWSRTPEYNLLFIRCQQNYASDLLHSRGHVFLNEVYDMLGIERSKAGAVVGWVLDPEGDNFVDFGVFNGDSPRARDFVNGREGSILLDFNVNGVIYDRI